MVPGINKKKKMHWTSDDSAKKEEKQEKGTKEYGSKRRKKEYHLRGIESINSILAPMNRGNIKWKFSVKWYNVCSHDAFLAFSLLSRDAFYKLSQIGA